MKQIPKSYVRISVISNLETARWDVGQSILKAILDTDRRLFPEKVGTFEPLKQQVSNLDDCAPFWAVRNELTQSGQGANADAFLWKRSKLISSSGQMMHKSRSIHGSVKPGWLIFRASLHREVDWQGLFEKFCFVLQAEYATLNLVTSIEDTPKAFGEEADASYATNDYLNGIAPLALNSRGLSNLSWGNFFGPKFVSEVRASEILDAGFVVRRHGDGVLLYVTKDILTVEDHFDEFSQRRSELRKYFRNGLFRINHEPKRMKIAGV